MRGARRTVRLLAVMEPGAIQVLEYQEHANGVQLAASSVDHDAPRELSRAAERLATMLEAHGGRDREVAVAVRGFGSVHHMLQLPPAAPEVWAPIVEREIRILDPDLGDAVVAFSPAGMGTRGPHPVRDLLVGAVPQHMIEHLRRTLEARRMRLRFLTLIPAAVQCGYRETIRRTEPTVLVLSLPHAPLVCFFYEGELQLVLEPPAGRSTDSYATAAREAIERGVLHLRQRHRGARPETILFGGDEQQQEALLAELRQVYDAGQLPPMHRLESGHEFVGLGLLVAAASGTMNLLGDVEPRRARPHPALRAALLGTVVTVALWAVLGWAVAWRSASARDQEVMALRNRVARLSAWLPTLQERSAHHDRVEFASTLDAEYLQIERLLRTLGEAVPTAIRLDSLGLERAAGGWTFRISGSSLGADMASAISGLQRFSTDLARAGITDSELEEFDYLGPGEAEALGVYAGVRFRLGGRVAPGGQP